VEASQAIVNIDFYSIFHNASVTVNFVKIIEMLQGICLKY